MLLGAIAAKTVLDLRSIGEARGQAIGKDWLKYIGGCHPASRFYREDLSAKVKEDFAFIRAEAEKL